MVVNADDFGLTEGVSRGILAAHAAGALRSTSMFATAPGFAPAAALAARTPTLAVGLHFNLTIGAPVAPLERVPSLWSRRTGRFYPLRALAGRALLGRVAHEHVAVECRAQLERLVAAGIRVTHIDSHRHVHALPGIWRGVVAAAREGGARYVRIPVEPPLGRRALTKAGIAAMWRWASRGTGRPLPAHPEHFRGIGLLGSPRVRDDLLDLLERLPAGRSELMVHPGYADAELAAWDAYGAPRERELAALCAPDVLARLTRGDIVLTHFGEL